MAQKLFVKTNGLSWNQVTDFFVKTEAGKWSKVTRAFVKVASNAWYQFFLNADLPMPSNTDNISIRTGGYNGAVDYTYEFIDTPLYGHDGAYTNYTSISGRKFVYATTSGGNKNNLELDDILNTQSKQILADGTYVQYTVHVANGSDSGNSIDPISDPIFMIKRMPSIKSKSLSGTLTAGSTLTFNFNFANNWYESVDQVASKIQWYRSSNGTSFDTLLQETPVYLLVSSDTSSGLVGKDTYKTVDPDDTGSYIVVNVVLSNSYTNYPSPGTITDSATKTSTTISGNINITTNDFTDSVLNERAYDNSYGLGAGGGWYLNATATGVDSSTTYRTRYRIFNWQTAVYYNMNGTSYSNPESAWTSYTANSSGTGTISNVSISNGTATIKDYFYIDETYFNGSTYVVSGSALPRWAIEVEVAAIRAGATTTASYGLIYIHAGIYPSISVNKTSTSPNTSLTFSGTLSGYPSSYVGYPTKYKIDYGDGSDSGWQTFSYGTTTPQNYSLNHSYDNSGTYTATIFAAPIKTTKTTTITVSPALTAPTITNVTQVAAYAPITATVTGGGPYYQMYWTYGAAPTGSFTPDATSSTTTLTDSTGPTSVGSVNVYVRSTSSLNETSIGPSGLASDWANYPFTVLTDTPNQTIAPSVSPYYPTDVYYPNSISWSGGTYPNAKSVTSVLIYGIYPTDFKSPTFDTSASYRTANPYYLASNDGTGTPYYFAVRDTVIGYDNLSYYYYSYPNRYVRSQPGTLSAPTYDSYVSSVGGFTTKINNYDSNNTYSVSLGSYNSSTVPSVSVSAGTVTMTGMSDSSYAYFTVTVSKGGYSNNSSQTYGYSAAFSSPTPSSVSYSSNTFTINFSGGSGPYYQVWYQATQATSAPTLSGTVSSTPDATGSSSPITKTLTGSPGYTYHWWVRSAKTLNATGSGNVTDWSGPVSVTIPNVNMTTAPTYSVTNTTTGFTASVNNTPNPSGGTYGLFSNSNGNASTTVNYSTGAVTVTGLSAGASNTVTVSYSSFGYNTTYPTAAGTALSTYTISYNANGGTGAPSSQTKTSGNTLTLTSTKPTRSGYTFQNWNTNSSGTGTSYSSGGSFTTDADTTLYAIWLINAPANPTNFTINSAGTASWTASSTATSYNIVLWLASSSAGKNAYYYGTITGITGTSYVLPSGTNPTTGVFCNYREGYIIAVNAGGASGGTAWYPSSTTYV